eukprot:scaffold53532_cov68-Phaeocystis_antarctica.AAC.2
MPPPSDSAASTGGRPGLSEALLILSEDPLKASHSNSNSAALALRSRSHESRGGAVARPPAGGAAGGASSSRTGTLPVSDRSA